MVEFSSWKYLAFMQKPFWLTLLMSAAVSVQANDLQVSLDAASGEKQQAARVSYTFGIVPQQSASKLAQLWLPILFAINDKTGYQLVFKTAPTITEFENRLERGEYDFAYMNPYHYTIYHENPGYVAFARQKDKKITGILVAHNDSSIKAPSELENKVLVFPSPGAFAASILTRAYLKQAGINFSPKYVSSHDSVYRNVAAGYYPAGGGIERTFNTIDEEVRNKLRILWKSAPYTPHAFAVHPRVDPVHAKAIAQQLMALEQDVDGRALLSGINFKGIEPASDKEWDDVRKLQIDLQK